MAVSSNLLMVKEGKKQESNKSRTDAVTWECNNSSSDCFLGMHRKNVLAENSPSVQIYNNSVSFCGPVYHRAFVFVAADILHDVRG